MVTFPKTRKKITEEIVMAYENGDNILSTLVTVNPFEHGVECRATRQFQFAVNYANAVNNQRIREEKAADFSPESLWNGKGRWFDKVTVEHVETQARYFAAKPRQMGVDGKVVSIAKEWFNVATGQQIDVVNVLPWLLSSGTSKRQELDREVAWRTVAVENVLTFSVGGVTYNLTV